MPNKKHPSALNSKALWATLAVIAALFLFSLGYAVGFHRAKPQPVAYPLHQIVGCERMSDGRNICF